MQCKPIDWFLVDTNFYRLVFPSRLAIEIWILIPIILKNIFELYTEEIHTRYDKISIYEKNPQENYLHKKKS